MARAKAKGRVHHTLVCCRLSCRLAVFVALIRLPLPAPVRARLDAEREDMRCLSVDVWEFRRLLDVWSTRLQDLRMVALGTCNAAFPIETWDCAVAMEERLNTSRLWNRTVD